MKVNRNRHEQPSRHAAGVRKTLVGTALALCLAATFAGLAHGQSAGMANLLHRQDRPAGRASDASAQAAHERHDQQEARARADKHRAERDMAERAERQGRGSGNGNPKLSPDERRKLRQNLQDLSREMYSGG